MKNSKKFIALLASTAAIATSVPLIVSCGNQETNIVTAIEPDGYIQGSDNTCELVYSLNHPLSENQYLYIQHPSTSLFKFNQPEVIDTHVSIKVSRTYDSVDTCYYNEDLTFVCKNIEGNTVWTDTAECFVMYSSMVSYKGKKEVFTDEGEKTYEFKFALSSLSQYYVRTIKPFIVTNSVSETDLKVAISDYTVDTENSQLNVTVEMSKTGSTPVWNGAEWANFNIEVYGLDQTQSQTWHTTTPLKLTYTSPMVAIDPSACTITNNVLEKVTLSSNTGENTLDLTKGVLADVTAIAADFWKNSTGLDNIIGLRMNSKCATIGNNAFKAAGLRYIDMTQMPSDAEWFKSGSFGTDAFAVKTLASTDSATIKYNPEWTALMKHRIKTALYKAGLTQQNWYDITYVNNYAELINAFQIGGFIKLNKDIEIPKTIFDKAGYQSGVKKDWTEEIVVYTSSCLDLNGFTLSSAAPIYYSGDDAEQTAVIAIWNGAELVVEDSSEAKTGTIKAYDQDTIEYTREGNTYCFNVHADNTARYSPSLVITGGNYYGTRSCIHNNGAQVEIDDGDFHLNKCGIQFWKNHTKKSTNNGCAYMLNCKDASYKAGEADYWVKGGRFYGWSFSGDLGENYYDVACDKQESRTVGETTINACYFYDHLPGVAPEEYKGIYKTVAHIPVATEEGTEGYYEVVLKE